MGSIILQEMKMLNDIILYSDFCSFKEIEIFHKRVYKMGRPDQSLQEKASSKKPSHSNIDQYHFMSGLKRNLVAEDSQLISLQLVKLRPVYGPT